MNVPSAMAKSPFTACAAVLSPIGNTTFCNVRFMVLHLPGSNKSPVVEIVVVPDSYIVPSSAIASADNDTDAPS